MIIKRLYNLDTKQFCDEMIHEIMKDENGGVWHQNKLQGNLVVVWMDEDVDIKEMLKDYKYLPELIKQTAKEIEAEVDRTMKYESSVKAAGTDGMPHGNETGNPTQEMAIILGEVNDRLRVLKWRLAELKNKQLIVEIMLVALTEQERAIIAERFINGETWEKSGYKNYTCRRTAIQKGEAALNKMKRLIA